MAGNKKEVIEGLGFKYERKRIKREVTLPSMCKDYEPESFGPWCTKAKLCKNATSSAEGKADGLCKGGTDPEEIERRQKKLLKV
jgi:hypothetical protein